MRGNKEGENIFGYGKCELIANSSAMRPLREGRDGKCEGRNEKCEFLARESVSSITMTMPIVRIFGKGKCKFIANFSAKMVTSLPSLSLSLSVSLSLSHRKYLTHNIGSASALPIIWRHCPGSMNRADLPSRGAAIQELRKVDWLHAPKWTTARLFWSGNLAKWRRERT